MNSNDTFTIQEIVKNLKNLNYFHIHLYDCVASTNDVLKDMAINGADSGTVVIAKSQTAGKGRKGHTFFSPENTGLYLSLLIRPSFSPMESVKLTPMSAVIAAEAIEEISGKSAHIKWVNDVLLDGKKVCGILTEASIKPDGKNMDYVIIGIGINLSSPEEGFPDELANIAGAVSSENDDFRAKSAALVLNSFIKYYKENNFSGFWEEYKKRLFFLGKEIEINSRSEQKTGIALDIDENYHLLVKTADGTIYSLDSGEISIKV